MKTKLLSALGAITLAGCAGIPAPDASWAQHTGQIQSRGGRLDIVGEITIRSDARHFLAEVSKGPGVPLLRIYADGASPAKVTIKGGTSAGGWSGDPASAPAALQAWALLPEVFHWAQGDVRDGDAHALKLTQSKRAERGGALHSFSYQRGAEKIVCHLNR